MNPLLAMTAGLTAGGTFALFGVLLTIMSRLGKVVNFSQVAVGVFAAFMAIRIVPKDMQPWGSLVVGMIVAMLLSILIGFIIAKWLGDAPVSARSALVAILLGLYSLSNLLFGTRAQPVLPPFKEPAGPDRFRHHLAARGRHDHRGDSRRRRDEARAALPWWAPASAPCPIVKTPRSSWASM